MATIQENIQQIRNAVYGRDVREAIADSIEQFDTYDTNTRSMVESETERATLIEGEQALAISGLNDTTSELRNDLDAEIERAQEAEGNVSTSIETISNALSELSEDLTDEISRAQGEENSKVSRPVSNPDGNSGQVLQSLGNGSTVWADPVVPDINQITDAVADWLVEHPEMVVSIQDDSIGQEKLSPELRRTTFRGGCITPLYVGGYLTTEEGLLPACCLKIGNYFYTIDCKHWYYSTNDGLVRKFDTLADEKDSSGNVTTQHNKEITSFQKRIKVGHANSIAYDTVNGKIYIAPVWEQSSGTQSFIQKLYVYNTSFTYQNDIETPKSVMGVSYDHVTSSLYCYCYRNSGTQIHEVYKLVNNSWVLYTTINLTDIIQCEDYNQDFAVYNNRFYISSPRGNMLTGILKQGSGESKVMTAFIVTNFDSTGRFRLGELEGMEFDPDGHLYANSFITFVSHDVTVSNSSVNIKDYTNACIIELPVGTAKAEDLNHVQGNVLASLKDNTLTLSELTKIRFRLNTWELRSISQLSVRLDHSYFTRISIASGNNITENFAVSIKQNIELYLGGNYTAKSLNVYAGLFSIYTDNDTHKLTLTNTQYLINLCRSAMFKICGSTSLRVETPNLTGTSNNFINVGNYMPIISIRTLPTPITKGKVLYLGSYKISSTGLFLASGNIKKYSIGETAILSNQNICNGLVTTGCTLIRLTFILPRNVPDNYNNIVIGTNSTVIIRGLFPYSSGYIGRSISINLTSSTYTTAVTAYNNTVRVVIQKANGGTFDYDTNTIINNMPICAELPASTSDTAVKFTFT